MISVLPEAAQVRASEAALKSPRAFARFLVGLGSPRLTSAKLTRHALFGRLADVPFSQVLARAESA